MTDAEAMELLRLLYKYVMEYVTEYDSCRDMRISEVADDLAMSMDGAPDEAERIAKRIVIEVSPF
jgi:hypothetical protein